jgi:hypothetical protein
VRGGFGFAVCGVIKTGDQLRFYSRYAPSRLLTSLCGHVWKVLLTKLLCLDGLRLFSVGNLRDFRVSLPAFWYVLHTRKCIKTKRHMQVLEQK